jgi:hypothetical protein
MWPIRACQRHLYPFTSTSTPSQNGAHERGVFMYTRLGTDKLSSPPSLSATLYSYHIVRVRNFSKGLSGLKFFHQRNLYIVSPIHFISKHYMFRLSGSHHQV